MGGSEELSSQRRRWWVWRWLGLSWPEAAQRYARIEDRSRFAPLPQGSLAGVEAVVHGPRGDREPQCTGDGLRGDARDWKRGARLGCAAAEPGAATRARDGGCGSSVRHPRLRAAATRAGTDTSRRAEHVATSQRDRWTYDAFRRLSNQPGRPEACRASVRLDQGCGPTVSAETS